MNYQELDDYLNSNQTLSDVDEETVFHHFILNHDIAPYKDGYLAILGGDRDFHGKNHIITIHHRNNPKIPLHIFHYIKINYVFSGSVTFLIDDHQITLHKGDLIIIDKHVPHGILETTEKDLLINIILNEDFFTNKFINRLPDASVLSKFIKQLLGRMSSHNHYLVCYTKEDFMIHQCAANILCEHLDPQICSEELIDNYIISLITHLIRGFEFDTNIKRMKKNEYLINLITDYIQKNYVEGNLTSMCACLGYDPTYISNFIKKQTGTTFKKLVFESRINKATLYLLNTNYPIHEIAKLVGFHNLTSFYTQFQKQCHCKPNEFRSEKNQNRNSHSDVQL